MRGLPTIYRQAFSGLPTTTWLLAAMCLVHRAGTMVLPFLSLYLERERALPVDEVGVLLATWGAGSAAGCYLGGRLADRFGTSVVQMFGLCATGLGFWSLAALRSPWWIAAGLFVTALLGDTFRPANAACVAATCPLPVRAKAMALNRLAINLGCAIGPALGGFLARLDYTMLFVVDGATSFAAAWVFWRFLRRRVRDATPRVAPPPDLGSASLGPLRDRVLVVCLLLTLLSATVVLQISSTMPIYLQRFYHLREDAIGLLFAVNPVLIVLFEMVLVDGLKHRPPLRMVAVGIACVGLGFGLLPLGSTLAFALLTVVLWTVGEMLEAPQMWAFVASRAPDHARGSTMGLYILAFSAAHMTAPILGTQVWKHWGPHHLWVACAAVMAIAAGGYLLLADRVAGIARRSAAEPPLRAVAEVEADR